MYGQKIFGGALLIGGMLSILSGIGILLFYGYSWLRYGGYDPYLISILITPRPASWVGVDQIIRWVISLPLWLGCIVVGFLAFFLGIAVSNDADRSVK